MVYFSQANVCLVSEQSRYAKGMYSCLVCDDFLPYDTGYIAQSFDDYDSQAGFDILAVVIAALNSFDKPYRRRSDVINSLRRDGIIWFTVRHRRMIARSHCLMMVSRRYYSVCSFNPIITNETNQYEALRLGNLFLSVSAPVSDEITTHIYIS